MGVDTRIELGLNYSMVGRMPSWLRQHYHTSSPRHPGHSFELPGLG